MVITSGKPRKVGRKTKSLDSLLVLDGNSRNKLLIANFHMKLTKVEEKKKLVVDDVDDDDDIIWSSLIYQRAVVSYRTFFRLLSVSLRLFALAIDALEKCCVFTDNVQSI